VYNSFTPEGMPQSFIPSLEQDDEKANSSSSSDIATYTKEFFERSSIRLILAGHKPQGDMPSPIRIDHSSWVICADTSYSGDTIWFHLDSDDDFHSEEDDKQKKEIESSIPIKVASPLLSSSTLKKKKSLMPPQK